MTNKKVRLLAVDSKIPNLAIMKISSFHKAKGDDVNWYEPMFDMYDTDLFYESKVFTFSPEYQYYPVNAQIIRGGTGVDIKSQLPSEIESVTELDYSLYPGYNQKHIVDEDLERVLTLKELGVNPFAMGYIDFENPSYEKPKEIKDFCRWVNMKATFKTVSWNEYKKK